MGVVALVMAGGRGTRMGGSEEKPLVKVRGKPMIDYVLHALKKAAGVDRIIVAVSRYTPQTARRVKELSVEAFETPGADFVSDMKYAISELGLGRTLIVSADLPLLTSDLIEDVLRRYEQCGKPSISVMVPEGSYKRMGLTADLMLNMRGSRLVPVGINVIDGEKIDEPELEQENFIATTAEVTVNINSPEDLQRAELLLDQIEKRKRRLDREEIRSS